MKRIGYLFEKAASFGALREAAMRAARGKRHATEVCDWLLHLESRSLVLEKELLEGHYQPEPYRLFTVYEKKPRQICASSFRDRVVHHALCAAIEPTLDKFAIYDSYACRKDKGTHAAVSRAQDFARDGGFFLKLDVAKFFESIDGEELKKRLRRKFKDARLLALMDQIIDHRPPTAAPGKGLPIGNLTSQHWANFYLDWLDHWIKEQLRISRYLRYMDDMILFAHDKPTLWTWKQQIEDFLAQELKLSLQPTQTLLAPVHEGIPFLGFRVWPSLIRLDQLTKQRFLKNYRKRWKQYTEGQLTEDRWLRSVRSLVGHISHANTYQFRRSFFAAFHPHDDTDR